MLISNFNSPTDSFLESINLSEVFLLLQKHSGFILIYFFSYITISRYADSNSFSLSILELIIFFNLLFFFRSISSSLSKLIIFYYSCCTFRPYLLYSSSRKILLLVWIFTCGGLDLLSPKSNDFLCLGLVLYSWLPFICSLVDASC